MITLSALAVIGTLSAVLVGYLKLVNDDAQDTTAMIQADIYYADVTAIFSRFKKKKTLFTTLYAFPISMKSPDGKFAMSLSCKALSKGANINWLGLQNDTGENELNNFAQSVFEMLVQEHNIEDAARLLEMLKEEIGGNNKYVKKEYSRLRQKNGIIAYKQFAQVISRYQLEVDDMQAGKVPWKKYFTFSKDATRIDAEYSSAELIALLFDLDVASVTSWSSDPDRISLRNFVTENGGNYASRKKIIAGEKFLEESECTVGYSSRKKQYHFRFEYIQGEAKHFEFFGAR